MRQVRRRCRPGGRLQHLAQVAVVVGGRRRAVGDLAQEEELGGAAGPGLRAVNADPVDAVVAGGHRGERRQRGRLVALAGVLGARRARRALPAPVADVGVDVEGGDVRLRRAAARARHGARRGRRREAQRTVGRRVRSAGQCQRRIRDLGRAVSGVVRALGGVARVEAAHGVHDAGPREPVVGVGGDVAAHAVDRRAPRGDGGHCQRHLPRPQIAAAGLGVADGHADVVGQQRGVQCADLACKPAQPDQGHVRRSA